MFRDQLQDSAVFAGIVLFAVFCLILMACWGCGPIPPTDSPPPDNADMTSEEFSLFRAHNDYRREKNVPLFGSAVRLMQAARSHANWMATNQRMSHIGDGGSTVADRLKLVGYRYSAAGENIAKGYATVEDVMRGWKSSSGHNRNLLNASYSQLGVAISKGKDNRLYWCVVFGRPATTAAGEVLTIPKENLPEGIEE